MSERMSIAQTWSAYQLVLLGFVGGDIEHQMHRKFSSIRVRGEWYRTTVELCELIDDLLFGDSLRQGYLYF